ncbi:dienelactone hydrolase family protein [Marinobacter sp. X15-166B]|uniref:dienelactone hydrolase family protein n=1 Tax=Marinobacter sp. X15-166B TaxID=1897620 RepID=UPI00085CC4B2|nr:dienelactone hydrolase family protein [Marinobacter sp. X15-166B]OEY65919.1 hypothetical protein BG841_05255 [Marinobacter sp. X15-166B]
MTGKMVEFASNGVTSKGYLAIPGTGSGPAVIVLQEWWGLVEHIKEVCDRFAEAGFVALAPDLYHGKAASSPDEAGRMMMALNIDRTEQDLRGAIDYLLGLEASTGNKVGTVGFCMGGQLSLYTACANDKVGACVNYYGVHPDVHPDLAALNAPVLGFFAENDRSVPVETAHKLEADLKTAGKDVEMHIYPGAEHAFFNNTRKEVYNEEYAQDSWKRMTAFFKANLS